MLPSSNSNSAIGWGGGGGFSYAGTVGATTATYGGRSERVARASLSSNLAHMYCQQFNATCPIWAWGRFAPNSDTGVNDRTGVGFFGGITQFFSATSTLSGWAIGVAPGDTDPYDVGVLHNDAAGYMNFQSLGISRAKGEPVNFALFLEGGVQAKAFVLDDNYQELASFRATTEIPGAGAVTLGIGARSSTQYPWHLMFLEWRRFVSATRGPFGLDASS
jgi:hypothetical protein